MSARRLVVCADFGSTFTKLTAVSLESGQLLGTAAHPTTIDTDVMDGFAATLADLSGRLPAAADAEVLACSSAGGGLRLAVVGYERAVTAEAGYRVGLSAGARVVHVAAGQLGAVETAELVEIRPDVVLLAGGTDGGNADVLLANAAALAASELTCPIVVAGNIDVREDVWLTLTSSGKSAIPTANVLPRIGVLDPGPARAAIREVFITHVIGGKGLSSRADFPHLVKAATPDAVLAGVELLADGLSGVAPGAGDIVVVDVGGATTDVYSVVTPDAEESELRREVVEQTWRGRTVEGDLGVRWSAPGVVEAAIRERLLPHPPDADDLARAAATRANDPSSLPATAADADIDAQLAALAATVALRRHARPHVVPLRAGARDGVRRGGKDLRQVRLAVGSGGVLRSATAATAESIMTRAITDPGGGWRSPEAATVVIDRDYVLAAAGLLSFTHPDVAVRLLRHLPTPPPVVRKKGTFSR
jgi:uncharacterized protein (TIGR01319 family)